CTGSGRSPPSRPSAPFQSLVSPLRRVPACYFPASGRPPSSPLLPYTTLFRSQRRVGGRPVLAAGRIRRTRRDTRTRGDQRDLGRSEEHTSELQSRFELVCRLLREKKN